MKYPNVNAVRRQLPHGAMTQIANDLGISVRRVSDFFVKGWHKDLTNDILSRAIEIIKAKIPDEDLMKELDDLKLTSDFYVIPISRKKKKNNPGNPDEEVNEITQEDIDSLAGILDELQEGFDELPEEDEVPEVLEAFEETKEDFDELSEQFEDEDSAFEDIEELYSGILEVVDIYSELLYSDGKEGA